MPPLNLFLPKLATDSLRRVNVHSTVDFLSADNNALLNAFQDEQIRQSLLLFLMKSNATTYQNTDDVNRLFHNKPNTMLNNPGNGKRASADTARSHQLNNRNFTKLLRFFCMLPVDEKYIERESCVFCCCSDKSRPMQNGF